MSKNTATETKKLDGTRIFLIVFACVALVGILTASIFAIVAAVNKKNNSAFDYMKVDLKKYVEVSSDLYSSYEVKIDVPAVSDQDFKDAILKVLCKNKITPDTPVINLPNITLSAGDVANIYYRGYTLGENDKKEYFDGGCNFGDSTAYSLELGSGSFIPGFEYNLLGKNQKDYASMEKLTSGMVQAGDIIKLTYSSYYADGTARMSQTATIDLSDPTVDDTWGKGFVAYFTDNHKLISIGEKFATDETGNKLMVETTRESDDPNATDCYFDMTVSEVYRVSKGERLVVEAYFPSDYSNSDELKGKTAYFEVYIRTAKDYEVPEYNDEFITNTLKISAEDLSSYEGDTLVEKYENSVKADLEKTYNENVSSAVEVKFWDHIIANANFKKLPESEVNAKYNEDLSEINSMYASYSSYYSSLDAFARDYLGLDSKADWKATLRSNAETTVKQKLAFYCIVRQENMIPSDAEYTEIYNRLFDEYLQSYLEYYKITEDSENYETKVEEAKSTIKAQFADSYWFELVVYDYAIDKLVDNATVKNG